MVHNKKNKAPSTRIKTRKELRKEQRKMKKQRRFEYYTNRKKPGRFVLRPPDQEEATKTEILTTTAAKQSPKNQNVKQFSGQSQKLNDIEKEKREQKTLEKKMQKQRSKLLIESNLEEDRNIKRLEKQLKLNKRKTQSIPKSFVSDGLDYILEMCDAENMKSILSSAHEINDSGGEFDEDFALMADNSLPISKENEISSDHSDNELQSEDDFNENDSSEENSLNENDNSSINNSECLVDEELDSDISDLDDNNEINEDEKAVKRKRKNTETKNSSKKQRNISKDNSDDDLSIEYDQIESDNVSNADQDVKDTTWEDIYGRIRGKDGSIIQDNNGKYVPPAIRAKMANQLSDDKKRIEKLNRLEKQIKGLLNRLTEANMHSISSQLEELYMNNSRNDMNDTVTNLMLNSLVSKTVTTERLLLEHVMLITILHANVGTEVGAHFLHSVVKQFNILFNSNQEMENKMLDNNIGIIAQLYNFKIFHSKLLYQLLTKLSNRFDEKSVECILSILKNVGFTLRKDDPLALKDFIIELQKKCADAPDESIENSRVKYMLDILLAIKNNNMTKIPNFDTSYSEHLKKLQKNFIRKGNYVTQLNISLDDLLEADKRGKWWIVGSAWSGIKEENLEKETVIKTESFSQKLLDLARKQRMNTDARRNIFCIIMSAEDYLDAFEKLLHLGLKNQQEREIIHVILHCCLREKKFNLYYAVLAQKFCEYDRKYQMIIKCSVWDKLKALTECSASQISNLAKLLTHLFLEKGLPISTLKIVQFSELDKISLRFIRQILLGILLCEDVENCTAVFEKVGQSDKLAMFRESLKLFIRHFLLKNLKTDNIVEDQKVLLKSRCDIVEKMLSISDKRTRF